MVQWTLRNIREARGLTMEQVRDLGGPVPSTVSRLESGIGDPEGETVRALARVYAITEHAVRDAWEASLAEAALVAGGVPDELTERVSGVGSRVSGPETDGHGRAGTGTDGEVA